jgi:adenylate cyclase
VRAKGFTEPITVHDVRGLAGEYNLQLPSADRALTRLAVPKPIGMAMIKDKIVGEKHPAEVIASGEEAARVRTALMVAPFDDLMFDVDGKQAFVKVIECEIHEGVCDLFAVYTAVTDDVRRVLLGFSPLAS